MSSQSKTVFQALAQSVRDHGAETMFGLMGDANLFLIDHFVRQCAGRFVPAAHEASAVLMALAYAQVCGRVGVATVTHGPALTNCATALTEGARGNIPIVLIAGDTPALNPRHLQSIDQREVVRATGAGFEQMRAPQTATADLARAFSRARTERRPIVLNMPADYQWMPHPDGTLLLPVFDTPALVPEGEALDEAIGIIASARRPLVLAGAGAIHAREPLIRLAERLEAPLATTLKAKGLFDGHPFDIGIFGTLSTEAANARMAKADCVICFGSGLHDFTTDKGALVKGKRLVQVDTERRVIGRSVHPDVALIADAGLTASNIVHWLDEAEIPASGFTREFEDERLATHPTAQPERSAPGTVSYVRALDELEKVLPKDRILVTDGGRFMTEVWCRLSVTDPGSFVVTANFGAIGLGLQEAIGAGMAAPARPVVLFSGDGGFMMGGINEFNTAVRLQLDLIVVICNDRAYGAEHIQFVDRKMDPGLTLFDWPSFTGIADALGGYGVRVDSDDALSGAVEAIRKRSRNRPLLIELILDPENMPRMRV